jgi:hypothetical protein
MAMKRPFPVTFLACLFIAAGLLGLLYHLTDKPLDREIVFVSMVRILAVIGGVFLLRGHNWARWLLLAWVAFHVIVSAFQSLSQTIAHVVLLMLVTYFLFTPPACKFFQSSPPA